jgi:hypothetical protein
MNHQDEILKRGYAEEERKQRELKKEAVDLGTKEGFRIAYLAEKKKEPTPVETEKFKSAVIGLNTLISKSNSMDEKILFSVAEMVERGDARGISKLFEKNPDAAKAANAMIENREMCEFVIRNAYANMAFTNEFGRVMDVRDLLKVHIAIKKDPKYRALLEELRKDERFRATQDKTDPIILYLLMKNLLPSLMASGMFGNALKSFMGKIMGTLSINIASSEKGASLIGNLAKAVSIFGTGDGFVLGQILGGLAWKG